MLGIRKLVAIVEQSRFEEEHGHAPTEHELKSRCQRAVGERGWLLAEKGMSDVGQPNLLADEELVTWAVLAALLTGRETMIVTRDRDVLEQFYKLIYLLDTHYRGQLIAEQIATQPWLFKPVSTKQIPGLWESMRQGRTSIVRMPFRFDEKVLPASHTPVNVGCWLLGGEADNLSFASLSFAAEREMLRLLSVKGSTMGLNTTRLEGLNCHRCFCPQLQDQLVDLVAIADDRRTTFFDIDFPVVDVELAVRSFERTRRIEAFLSCPAF